MHLTNGLSDYQTNGPGLGLGQCFSTFSVKRNPLQQFWLLTEPVSFWGLLRPEGPKFEAEGQEWGSYGVWSLGECCKLP